MGLNPATFERLVVMGASRGIGAAAALHFAPRTRDLVSVSRSPAAAGRWIAADVSTDAGIAATVAAVGSEPLDALLYLGGIWETGAFRSDYDFAKSPPAETRAVINVNLIAPILLTQALAPALARAANPRVVLMGSTAGLPGAGDPEVANTASKAGLIGAAEAMAQALRPSRIGVTVINPGDVATPEVENDIATGTVLSAPPIPIADLLAAIEFVLTCSPAAVPRQINLHQADR